MAIKDILKKPATWVAGLIGLLLFVIKLLANKNDSLKAKEKLSDSIKEDAIINTKRDQIKSDIAKEQNNQAGLKEEAKKEAKGASEDEIRDFYKKRT